jgi:hypothetical protein
MSEGPEPSGGHPESPTQQPRAAGSGRKRAALLVAGVVGLAGAVVLGLRARTLLAEGTSSSESAASAATREEAPRKRDRDEDQTARAARLRGEAAAACAASEWRKCENKLAHALRLDPAGESDPMVQRLREQLRTAKPSE